MPRSGEGACRPSATILRCSIGFFGEQTSKAAAERLSSAAFMSCYPVHAWSVCRGPLRSIDQQHLDRILRRFQLRPELLLNGGEYRRSIRISIGRTISRTPFKREGIVLCEAGFVQDRPASGVAELARQPLDGSPCGFH